MIGAEADPGSVRGGSTVNIIGIGKRVRIYVGESDQAPAGPLFLAILETLRAEGCAGATVLRGVAGFGANSRIHTATVLRLSEDLPVVVEWVDTPERVERVLPKVSAMVADGLITVEDVEVIYYRHRIVEGVWNRLLVREVMTRDVATIRPEASMRQAVELLLNREYRALPVVDGEGRVVGIVTNGDLIERGGLRLRVEMLGAIEPRALGHEIASLESEKTVAAVMNAEVVTVGPAQTLAEAAHVMVTRRLKRLPVVDTSRRLLGMVSRLDLLRASAETYRPAAEERPSPSGGLIGDVMRVDVPVVLTSAPIADVLDAVVSTRLNRALVVDSERRVVGAVSDAELVRRLSPKDHPGIVEILMSRLPFSSLDPERRRDLERATGSTAASLMSPLSATVGPETPLGEATKTMLRERLKILPVVDREGRLLGAVDRADLLRIVASHGFGG